MTWGAPDACLGRLEDTLPEECDAGPPVTLALHELEAMDMSFRDPVAPFQGESGFNRDEVLLQPTREASQLLNPSVGGLGHPRLQVMALALPDHAQKA